MNVPATGWRRFWAALRAITGDDAYERYLEHRRLRHAGEAPLDRRAFYRAELERRWTQPSRCC
ncbi:MAG: CstA-like transporter-associated (seleno)protein [Burkholderiales bacterium]